MTTRERVIVSVTVVVVLLGGAFYLHDWALGLAAGSDVAEHDSSSVKAFIADWQAKLTGAEITGSERTVLSAVRYEWDGQPFADAPPPTPAELEEVVVSSHVYTGYIQAGGRRFAIINGREYGVNDRLQDQSGMVQVIEPDYVVLRIGRYGQRQVIPLMKRATAGERK
ncbi:MAG: hypothetical protein ACNA71_06505 [Kiritimatiellia bacterium]